MTAEAVLVLLAATLLDELTAFELLAALDELTELLDELTELELLTGFSLSELAAALSATLAEVLSSLAALEAAVLLAAALAAFLPEACAMQSAAAFLMASLVRVAPV